MREAELGEVVRVGVAGLAVQDLVAGNDVIRLVKRLVTLGKGSTQGKDTPYDQTRSCLDRLPLSERHCVTFRRGDRESRQHGLGRVVVGGGGRSQWRNRLRTRHD